MLYMYVINFLLRYVIYGSIDSFFKIRNDDRIAK